MIFSITDTRTAFDIAGRLLDVEAIKLQLENPFTWSSGWKSPIYCDNRVSLSYPEIRGLIKRLLAEKIKKHFPKVDTIAGVATAGVPQGALVADLMGLPFCYVRSKPKGHGMQNLIEGVLPDDSKVVVIEDLISTGGSSLKAVEALRREGAEVLGLGAIFSYDFPVASNNFEREKVDAFILSDYNFLIQEAIKRNFVKEEDKETLEAWRQNPAAWKI